MQVVLLRVGSTADREGFRGLYFRMAGLNSFQFQMASISTRGRTAIRWVATGGDSSTTFRLNDTMKQTGVRCMSSRSSRRLHTVIRHR